MFSSEGAIDGTKNLSRLLKYLESLAKYAELNIGLNASQNPHYKPIAELMAVSDYKEYKTMNRFFNQQLEEVKRVVNQPNEIRF
jgi:hypothetical protein